MEFQHFSFLTGLFDIWFIYNKLKVLKTYNSVCFDVDMFLKHITIFGNKYSYLLQKFPPISDTSSVDPDSLYKHVCSNILSSGNNNYCYYCVHMIFVQGHRVCYSYVVGRGQCVVLFSYLFMDSSDWTWVIRFLQ